MLIYGLGRRKVQRKKMETSFLKVFLCAVNRRSEKETVEKVKGEIK
jgi:hypothetical protein